MVLYKREGVGWRLLWSVEGLKCTQWRKAFQRLRGGNHAKAAESGLVYLKSVVDGVDVTKVKIWVL